MVERKNVPFVPDEKQQEALNGLKKFARDWVVAVAAQAELAKANPELSPKEIQSLLFSPDKNPAMEFAKIQRLKIPPDVMYNAYNEGSKTNPDELRTDIDKLKDSKSAAIDELKMAKPAHRLPETGFKTSQAPQILSPEQKEVAIKQIEGYVRVVEIRDAVAYDLMKDKSISPENQHKIKEFKEAAPNEFGARNPLKTLDSATLKANGLTAAFDDITMQTQQQIKEGIHDEKIAKEKAKLTATFTAPQKDILITGGAFHLPDDIKESALKEAHDLLNKFEGLKSFGANIKTSDIGKMAAGITPDGSITQESLASVLLAKSIKIDSGNSKVSISPIDNETYLLPVSNKDKPLVLETAKKILGDTYHKEVADVASAKTPAAGKREEAIKQIKDYVQEYEIRYAAVAGFIKDNPDIYQKNPNKIMEFMAIPNPLEAFNRDPQLARDLQKVFHDETKKVKDEIAEGEHGKAIEKMKEKLSDSFNAPLKKSKMEGADFDLPDSAKQSVREIANNLKAFTAEMPAGNPNLDSIAPRKSSSLML